MSETIESISKWADETFGLSTPEASLLRAYQEIDEFLTLHEAADWGITPKLSSTDPKFAEEAADVCITLYRYINLVDPEAIDRKMAINRARKWISNGDGTGRHVKEYEERETNS